VQLRCCTRRGTKLKRRHRVAARDVGRGDDRSIYIPQPDGSIGVIVPSGPGYVITPFPANPSYLPPQPYHGTPPASPYLCQPSPSYQYEYQRGGPVGCVYGCTGE
jgi:hypothetical protein